MRVQPARPGVSDRKGTKARDSEVNARRSSRSRRPSRLAAALNEGVLAVATPDVGSLAARLMGWRWWHFRLAHIGYFDRRTLDLATARAGFQPLARHRPGWFFSADYLLERALKLLAPSIRVRSPGVLRRLSVPVNLGDSLLGIYRKTRA